MSDFLEELGCEIDRAAAARVRTRRVPLALPVAIVAALVVAVGAIVLVGGGGQEAEVPAVAPPAAERDFPPPPPGLEGVRFFVANGTGRSGLAARYAERLMAAGWPEPAVSNAAYQDFNRTMVVSDPGNHEVALRVADTLGMTYGDSEANFEPGVYIFLGDDAETPVDQGESDAGTYGIYAVSEAGGRVCLERRLNGVVPAISCGDPPSAAEPIGLVIVDPGVREGKWLVHGYVDTSVERIELGDGTEIAPEAAAGVPGLYFSALVDGQPSFAIEVFEGAASLAAQRFDDPRDLSPPIDVTGVTGGCVAERYSVVRCETLDP